MKTAILAGQKHLLSSTIPTKVIDLVASFKETVRSDLCKVDIIKSQEEKRACCISCNNDTAISIALYLGNRIFMNFESLDQGEFFLF